MHLIYYGRCFNHLRLWYNTYNQILYIENILYMCLIALLMTGKKTSIEKEYIIKMPNYFRTVHFYSWK